jgi:succinate dehydrogenase / fumarate reductase cytochrome b subunit
MATTTVTPVPLYRTTVGKKMLMAGSGIVLVGFVLAHMVGNLKIFLGRTELDSYAQGLRTLGEPIFPEGSLLWALRTMVFAAFVIHIACAIQLSLRSRAARKIRYQKTDHVKADIPAVTMRWGGLFLALFVVFHLANFTWGNIHPGYTYVRGHVYNNVVGTFKQWWMTLIYLVMMGALGLHLFHGTWSMFQTLGWNNRRWNTIVRRATAALAVIIVLGFISVPIAVYAGVVS